MTFGKKQNKKDNKCLENYFQDILTIQLYGAHTLIIKLKKKKKNMQNYVNGQFTQNVLDNLYHLNVNYPKNIGIWCL